MSISPTSIPAKKELYSFSFFDKKIHFKLHEGNMYILFVDITNGIGVNYQTYLKKLDSNVELKYPVVIFESNYNQEFISISTLMRFLADIESAGGHFKDDESLPAYKHIRYRINQFYLAFK